MVDIQDSHKYKTISILNDSLNSKTHVFCIIILT